MKKKIIIAIIIIVVLIVVFKVYGNYKRNQELALATQKVNTEQTSGSGLLGYFTNLFNINNQESKGLTESEALALSVEISNMLELNTESSTDKANGIIQEMFVGGWTYKGYNQVEAIA